MVLPERKQACAIGRGLMPRSYGENETPRGQLLAGDSGPPLDGTSPRGASSLFDRGESNGREAAPDFARQPESRRQEAVDRKRHGANKRQVDRRRRLHELGDRETSTRI
jgi:hypothetical protein